MSMVSGDNNEGEAEPMGEGEVGALALVVLVL
jgi:hypothetical protein